MRIQDKLVVMTRATALGAAIALCLAQGVAAAAPAPKDAEPATRAANAAVAARLQARSASDAEDARRGFIGTIKDAETLLPDGRPAYTIKGFEFLDATQTPPSTVHPGLWESARLNNLHGLFKVTDRVYQVRGLDIANLTIVEGDTGLILVDALMTSETAHAALELYYRHRPRKPVVAVIYNHSHVDHFGGIRGVVSDDDVKAGRVQIIAPAGFMQSAISENVLAGPAMNRRAQYQFGMTLPRGERAMLDLGGAKALVTGTISLIAPTRVITQPVETITIDGVEIVNLLAPGTEAPAEMIHFFPQFKVLDTGELAVHALHQLLTLRGAEVRDGNAWAKYLNAALARFGDNTDILVGQHMWPVFGHDRVVEHLSKTRDLYKWIHDQTLRLMNHGDKPAEIAAKLNASMPASLAGDPSIRGVYGSVGRNAKAVYQQYIGWYDGNPVDMEPLTAAAYGRKFVEYAGGADALLARARADYARGDYQWVAQATNALVFADPANRAARELCADALEQLGYQHESAVERNAYLTGAQELRKGVRAGASVITDNAETLRALAIEDIFDLLGARLNAPKAEGKRIVLNWDFTDTAKRYVLNLENSALTFTPDRQSPAADLTLHLDRNTFNALLARRLAPEKAVQEGRLRLEGNPAKLRELFGLMDEPTPDFGIVAPGKN